MRNHYYSVQTYLSKITKNFPDFEDDGGSFFPDWIYRRWRLGRAFRIHDWHYCARCHAAGTMDQRHRKFSDKLLQIHSRKLLPWWMRITPTVLYYATRIGAGTSAWNSCGPFDENGNVVDRCRHNMAMPDWMEELSEA